MTTDARCWIVDMKTGSGVRIELENNKSYYLLGSEFWYHSISAGAANEDSIVCHECQTGQETIRFTLPKPYCFHPVRCVSSTHVIYATEGSVVVMSRPTLPAKSLSEPLQTINLPCELGTVPPTIFRSYVAAHSPIDDTVCVWAISLKNWDVRLPVWKFFATGATLTGLCFVESTLVVETANGQYKNIFVHELSWADSIPHNLNHIPPHVRSSFQIQVARDQPIHATKDFVIAAYFDHVDIWDVHTGKPLLQIPVDHPQGQDEETRPPIAQWPDVFIEGPFVVVVATNIQIFDLSLPNTHETGTPSEWELEA